MARLGQKGIQRLAHPVVKGMHYITPALLHSLLHHHIYEAHIAMM